MQQPPMSGTASGAVYVQTNAAPNEVIAFRRGADGCPQPADEQVIEVRERRVRVRSL